MAITADNAVNQIAYGLAVNSSRLVVDKASISNAAAGQYHSLWRATGQPGQGAIPGAAAVCAHGLLGSFNFTQQVSPITSYIGYMEFVCSNSATVHEIHDRLMHMGGLSGIVTNQAVSGMDFNGVTANNMAERIGDANYSDIQWRLEWYTDTGSTVATATIAVTYNDGTTGNLSTVSLAATRRASLMIPLNGLIPAAAAGKFIRAVTNVTLSVSTGTAGSFGVTATRKRASVTCPVANLQWSADWADLPIASVPNDSCLFVIQLAGTTSTGTVRGGGKVAHI